MSNETIPVTITILDKEYKIACPIDEHDSLVASASHVHENMKKIRDGGKAIGAERVAVMAAINIAHELHNLKKSDQPTIDPDILARIEALQQTVDTALKSSAT